MYKLYVSQSFFIKLHEVTFSFKSSFFNVRLWKDEDAVCIIIFILEFLFILSVHMNTAVHSDDGWTEQCHTDTLMLKYPSTEQFVQMCNDHTSLCAIECNLPSCKRKSSTTTFFTRLHIFDSVSSSKGTRTCRSDGLRSPQHSSSQAKLSCNLYAWLGIS